MAVAGWIDECLADGEPGIITYSNLRHAYRTITVGDWTGVTLTYLEVEERLIVDRVSRRKRRYMPPLLLNGPFETSEEPTADEQAIVIRPGGTVADTVIDLLRKVPAFQHIGSRDGVSR